MGAIVVLGASVLIAVVVLVIVGIVQAYIRWDDERISAESKRRFG